MPRHSATAPRTRRPGRVRAILAAGMVLGVGAVATFALFSDEAKMTSTFTTGKVDLTLDSGAQGVESAYEFSTWSKPALKPGDVSWGLLKVNNAGTLPFTYTMGTPSFPAAGESSQLALAIQAGARIVTGNECDQAAYDASQVIVAPEAALSAMTTDLSPRTLEPETSDTLCFKATLPVSSDAPELQGATVTPQFTFKAEQVTS